VGRGGDGSYTYGGRTVTVSLTEAVFPSSSVTCRTTVYSPLDVYVWEVDSRLPVEPSPNVHSYFTTIPFGSVQAEASQETIAGLLQEPAVRVKLATGGEFKREQAVARDRISTIRGTAAVSLRLGNIAIIALEVYIPLRCQAKSDLLGELRRLHPLTQISTLSVV
jgi:hypothetical protein